MKVGKVITIEQGRLHVRVASSIRGSSVNMRGRMYHFGNIGSYLKTSNALDEWIVCEIMSIKDTDPNQKDPSFSAKSVRELALKPIGTLYEKKFNLGVGVYPPLYADVEILTSDDMDLILDSKKSDNEVVEQAQGEKAGVKHESFALGVSKTLLNYEINISINDFFQIHSAVIGNTGSGKSNTIANILQKIMKKEDYFAYGAKIVIFDTNGEYKSALENVSEGIECKFYKPNLSDKNSSKDGYEDFILPHFLMNLEEWCAFLIATDATQRPFWNRVLQETYRFYKMADSKNGENREKFFHYFLHMLTKMIDNVLGQGESDTALITSAASIIYRIQNLIAAHERFKNLRNKKFTHKVDQNEKKNIGGILEHLLRSAELDFGKNKGEMKKAIGFIAGFIDADKVSEVARENYKQDVYYSHEYLRIAADICLLEEDSRGSRNMRNWTSTMLTRLDNFLEDDESGFMRTAEESNEECRAKKGYLKSLFSLFENDEQAPEGGVDGNEKDINSPQIIVIDTSELSPYNLEVLVSVVSRLIFEHRRDSKNREENPVHLVLDEAHRYIKKNQQYLIKENIFEKIAREGRKYACYLLVSSQRPSELSETVLSQCGNYIVHRIQNDVDMRYIVAIMPHASPDLMAKIRQSVPGEAMVFGNCVPLPLHVSIDKADPEPQSKNCDISEQWFREKMPEKR